MKGQTLLGKLEECGAMQKGHFLLSSGRHSDTYVQCARLFRNPILAADIGKQLASEHMREDVDLVLSPALGGIIPGFTTALALGCPMVFAERVEGEMRLRRGFELIPGQRVLIVEDVITTGSSVLELAHLAKSRGAIVLGIATVVLREDSPPIAHKMAFLVRVSVESYPPEDCPLCREGKGLDAPGSRYF